MNLLSLIIIFLALVICAAVGYIAWELTSERDAARPADEEKEEGGDTPP